MEPGRPLIFMVNSSSHPNKAKVSGARNSISRISKVPAGQRDTKEDQVLVVTVHHRSSSTNRPFSATLKRRQAILARISTE